MTPETLLRFLRLALLLFLPVAWIGFVALPAHELITFRSLLLITAVDLLLLAVLAFCDLRRAPLLGIVCYATLIFYLGRFIGLLFIPESIKYQTVAGFESADFERMLTYLLLGTGALCAGLMAGANIFGAPDYLAVKKPQLAHHLSQCPAACLAGISILIWIWFGYLYLGIGRNYFNVDLPLLMDLVGMIDGLTATGLLLIIVLEQGSSPEARSPSRLALTMLVMYILGAMVRGAKGAIYDLVTLTVMHCLCTYTKPRSARSAPRPPSPLLFAAVSVALLVMGLSVYIFASRARAVRKLTEYTDIPITVSMFLNDVQALKRDEFRTVRETLGAVSNRLSLLEPLMLATAEKGVDTDGYVNLTNDLKSAVNRVLPGTYFDDVIWSEQAFSMFYRGESRASVLRNYQGDEWSCYGLLLIYFGYWGGLLATFACSVGFSFMFVKLSNWDTGYRVFLQMWTMLLFAAWFNQLGFDNFASRAAGVLEISVINLMILVWLTGRHSRSLGKSSRQQPCPLEA